MQQEEAAARFTRLEENLGEMMSALARLNRREEAAEAERRAVVEREAAAARARIEEMGREEIRGEEARVAEPVVDVGQAGWVKDPKPFDGKNRLHLLEWIEDCNMRFAMQPTLFALERTRCYFGYSFLEGDARVLAKAYVGEGFTWDDMVNALGNAYGLHQRRAKAEKDLLGMRQGQNEELGPYGHRFRAAAALTDVFDDRAKKSIFRASLNRQWDAAGVQMLGQEEMGLREFENELHRWEGRGVGGSGSGGQGGGGGFTARMIMPAAAPTAPVNNTRVVPSTAGGAGPMDIDAATGARQRARLQCWACNGFGHKADRCPNRGVAVNSATVAPAPKEEEKEGVTVRFEMV